ncbi:MAG: ATP-binding cassette domain-containing protein [Chloroflexota bacterium]|nr:ATP-binding cassette domain-containing protein [Chloroflexota bacterium]
MIPEPAIRIQGVRKAFGQHVVLDGIDLEVAPGTVFALLGPNGAGKTTLIRILATLTTPDEGAAWVAGHEVATAALQVKRSISLTGQYAAVDEVLTGRENLTMIARLLGFSRDEARRRVNDLLTRFDLMAGADQRVATYSGGMRRRLDLAISLVTTPPVIFLDEPTTGLDTRSRQALWQLIRALAAQGVTILLTTQYLEEADQLADRIAVIDGGRIVAEGTAAELNARVGGEVIEIRNARDEIVEEIATDGSVAGLRAVVNGIDAAGTPGLHIAIRKPSLDDVFITLTGSNAGSRLDAAIRPELEVSHA